MTHTHPAFGDPRPSTTTARKLAALLLEQHETSTEHRRTTYTNVDMADAPALLSLALHELYRFHLHACHVRGITYGAFIGEMLAIADEVDAACPHCQSN